MNAPDAQMMAAVERLVRFMVTRVEADLAEVFADSGVVIVENFVPYTFHGPSAVRDWAAGFREHAANISQLVPAFGEPQDFNGDGERVYFALPTTWTGLNHGHRFSEDGGWSFILVRNGAEWRVQAYGWAVTAYRIVE
jgi:hypothetical protein